MHVVASEQLTFVAWFGPNETVVAPGVGSKSVPVIVTVVPPLSAPVLGEIFVTDSVFAGGADV